MKNKWLKELVVIVFLLGAALNTGCQRAKFDITGAWRVDYTLTTAGNFEVAFIGTTSSGIVIWNNESTGEYSVAGNDLEFVLRIVISINGNAKTVIYHFVGAFENADRMSGTLRAYDPLVQGSEINGTWFAQKI